MAGVNLIGDLSLRAGEHNNRALHHPVNGLEHASIERIFPWHLA